MVQYGSKITQNMKMAKIVQNNLGKIIWYSNTFKYFGRIYSFAKIFVDFSWLNLFGYSFVIFLSCRIYSDIHSSNIYGNEYIRIFIRPKIWYSYHTGSECALFGEYYALCIIPQPGYFYRGKISECWPCTDVYLRDWSASMVLVLSVCSTGYLTTMIIIKYWLWYNVSVPYQNRAKK